MSEKPDFEQILFYLNIWGDMDYENGKTAAHELLLDHRTNLVTAVEFLRDYWEMRDCRTPSEE